MNKTIKTTSITEYAEDVVRLVITDDGEHGPKYIIFLGTGPHAARLLLAKENFDILKTLINAVD